MLRHEKVVVGLIDINYKYDNYFSVKTIPPQK